MIIHVDFLFIFCSNADFSPFQPLFPTINNPRCIHLRWPHRSRSDFTASAARALGETKTKLLSHRQRIQHPRHLHQVRLHPKHQSLNRTTMERKQQKYLLICASVQWSGVVRSTLQSGIFAKPQSINQSISQIKSINHNPSVNQSINQSKSSS